MVLLNAVRVIKVLYEFFEDDCPEAYLARVIVSEDMGQPVELAVVDALKIQQRYHGVASLPVEPNLPSHNEVNVGLR